MTGVLHNMTCIWQVEGEALLAVNTMLQDSCHHSPLVRALVLNTLTYLHNEATAGIQQNIISGTPFLHLYLPINWLCVISHVYLQPGYYIKTFVSFYCYCVNFMKPSAFKIHGFVHSLLLLLPLECWWFLTTIWVIYPVKLVASVYYLKVVKNCYFCNL